MTHGTDSIPELSKKVSEKGRASALFVAHFFGLQLQKTLPYIDYLTCNEAEVWAGASGLPGPKDIPIVAKAPPNKQNPVPLAIVLSAVLSSYAKQILRGDGLQYQKIRNLRTLKKRRSAGPLKNFRFGNSLPAFGMAVGSFLPSRITSIY